MSAVISECGRYRYRLERHNIGGAGAIAWIMVNPSTADATKDDPTIRRVIGFSQRESAGWFIVGNKFAYRATDIKALRSAPSPIGPDNNDHLRAIISEAPVVVAAWGPLTKLPPQLRHRWQVVERISQELGVQLMCLGTAQDGHPRHPLMVRADQPLIPWKAPR